MAKKAPAVSTSTALTPAKKFEAAIYQQESDLKQLLGPTVPFEKFMQVARNAVAQNPKLLSAETDRGALFFAVRQAAKDGLVPDGREGAIVCYGNKPMWLPMVRGRRVQAARAGITIDAQVVYSNDSFEYMLGDRPEIIHNPAPLGTERGEIIGAYAIATLKDGTQIREVMHRDEIDRARSASNGGGGKGPWKDWYSEMARKTVIHRLAKTLPDDFIVESIQREETALYGTSRPEEIFDEPRQQKSGKPSVLDDIMGDGEVIEHDAPPPPDDQEDTGL